MLEAFEQFCKEHEKTIAFVEAFSTLAAVAISLGLALLARKANKTRIKAWVDVKRIVHTTIPRDQPLRYIGTTITNTGIMPVRIPFAFFHWQLPYERNASIMVMMLDAYGADPWVPQQTYPVEIPPRASHSFLVSDIETFRREHKEIISNEGLLRRVLRRFMGVTIVTDDGTRFKAKLGKAIRRELREISPIFGSTQQDRNA